MIKTFSIVKRRKKVDKNFKESIEQDTTGVSMSTQEDQPIHHAGHDFEMPGDGVCTTREAARLLGVSLRTIQLWVDGGLLQAWKTAGGHRRITLRSVEKLLAQQHAETAQPQATPQTTNLLVVEDDLILLKLYQRVIPGWGLPIQVHTARNGFDGLIKIGEIKPDILITDLNMPGMDGFRMIQTLQRNASFAHMKIIVITGLSSEDIERQGGLPEGVPVLSKPILFSQLQQRIVEIISANNPNAQLTSNN